MSGKLTLVLGGIRSGKSAYAEGLVAALGRPVIYLATGMAADDEMAARIRQHRERRPKDWVTVEEPLDLGQALERSLSGAGGGNAVLIDSVDTWISNLLFQHEDLRAEELAGLSINEIERLLAVLGDSPARVVMVSSEVGHGLVSPHELGRRFQDLLGAVNQQLAAAADEVYLVVAGIPLQIKPGGENKPGP